MAETFQYRAYGLRIDSEMAFPSLHAASEGIADVTVARVADAGEPREDEHIVFSTSGVAASGLPYLTVATADSRGAFPWRVRHCGDRGRADFLLRSGEKIEICTQGDMSAVDLEAYFTGPVLGHLMRARGMTCLHGGFVAPDGVAVGVVGPKGAGKSSLTAAWARSGVPVIADDIGALSQSDDERWTVAPGYPRLRLWRDTASALDLSGPDGLAPVMSFADKAYVDLREGPFRFDLEPRPLSAILLLRPRGEDSGLERLMPAKALVALLANVYAPRAGGHAARGRDIEMLTRVCSSVPVFQTSLPDRFDWLREESGALLRRLFDR